VSNPHFLYHKQKESWEAFERDFEVFDKNRKAYRNIGCRPETRSWFYRAKGVKEVTRKSLADILIVKAEQEELRKANLILSTENQVHNGRN
jgi:hypothetical protein